jgi:tetratricopeptide (TPR) repeat protein
VDRYDGDFLMYADRDPDGALPRYRAGIARLRILHDMDPSNADHLGALLRLVSREYTALRTSEVPGHGWTVAREQVTLARKLLASAPDSPLDRHNLRVALRNLGDSGILVREWAAAHDALEEALQISRRIQAASPDDPMGRTGVSESLDGFGQWHFARATAAPGTDQVAGYVEAQRHWKEAAAILEDLLRTQPEDTWGLAATLKSLEERLALLGTLIESASEPPAIPDPGRDG